LSRTSLSMPRFVTRLGQKRNHYILWSANP
jgi:hypothetical protein